MRCVEIIGITIQDTHFNNMNKKEINISVWFLTKRLSTWNTQPRSNCKQIGIQPRLNCV